MFGLLLLASPGPLVAEEGVDYARDVKPVLHARCYACHGVLMSESGLRLDTAALALQGGDSGPAVVPQRAEASLLIQRITAAAPSERMPPEGEPLTPAQIALLRAWIAQGAHAPPDETPEEDPRDHWSFHPPERPELPPINDATWSGNPIDRFIAREHARHSLRPRPPADKAVLLRRVSLDLTGLPPTRDELHEFLADTSPDAYERVVDRLLESPQYGERWARHWMDVWRYSDWFGRRMVPDVWNSAPQIWRWRDWIVQSLNEDKSYARMIQEMLAADEIAPEDPDAAVATGFLIRNWYALNPNDWMRSNVEHTAKAFLGLTFNCAHCHDHKYDPITQNDYFRMRAFFEPIGIRQDRVPGEADPGPFQEYEYSVLRKIVRLGAVSIFDKNPDAPTWFYAAGDERQRDADRGSIAPGLPLVFGRNDLAIEPVALAPTAWYPASRSAVQETILEEHRRAIDVRQQELAVARQKAEEALPGLREQLAADDAALSETNERRTEGESGSVVDAAGDATRQSALLQDLIEVQELTLRAADNKLLAAQAELASVEARIAADRARYDGPGAEDSGALTSVAALAERDARIKSAEAAVAEQERLRAAAESKPEDDAKRQEAIDAAAKKLEEVRDVLQKAQTAAIPSTYTPLGPVYPSQSTGRRKVLAEWIGSRDNPLTARVAINHMWMRHFHAPLVPSVFDFGRNGAPPTQPELLDWLAVELTDTGWSMKHVHRLIVTSRAYQMASSQGDEVGAAERDPQNRFLWRMNVGRMEAEVVRDSLLLCAGRLDPLIGGQELENKDSLTTYRRSLYYSCQPEVDGKSPLGTLFDAPDANECYRRTRSVVPQQALALANSDLIHTLSASLASTLCENVGKGAAHDSVNHETTAAALIRAAFEAILSRSPTPDEQITCAQFLEEQQRLMFEQDSQNVRQRAAESLIRVLFNHNDFVAIR